jgi:hypothetical protein
VAILVAFDVVWGKGVESHTVIVSLNINTVGMSKW